MKLLPTDVVVRYDRDEEKILFLVPRSADEVNELKRFYEFSDVSTTKKAKLAKELGIAVVAFLEATHRADFVMDDVSTPSKTTRQRQPRGGGKRRKLSFYDARLLIDRIDDDSSKEDVESIATVLKNASAAGDREAKRYLSTTWPRLREVLIRRVSRRSR